MEDQIDWDRVHRSNYESAAFWDIKWIDKARNLYECAKKLEPEVLRVWESYRAKSRSEDARLLPDHFQGAFFMLMAYAIENLLKAAAVASHSQRYKADFRAKKKFPRELRSHDLVKLAQFLDLKFSQDEEDLLRRLTRSAVWYGRYPAPLEYTAMAGAETFSDGNEYSVSWFGGDDIERLNAFVLSLPARLGLSESYWESTS